MITYNKKNTWKDQIEEDKKELLQYRESYTKKIKVYNIYLMTMDVFKENTIEHNENNIKKQELNNKLKIFESQIQKLDNTLNLLDEMSEKCNSSEKNNLEKRLINKYNQKYNEITKNYINNSLFEVDRTVIFLEDLIKDFTDMYEKTKQKYSNEIKRLISQKYNANQIKKEANSIDYMEIDKSIIENEHTNEKVEKNILKNNDTLLISEKIGKVILPYTAKEVKQILNNENDKYTNETEIIEEKFIRNLSDYKYQFSSRYKETMKLAKQREGYGFLDSITLSLEMMKKRYLHPAIISACRSLDELDVYLDCLDKNELDDFKIFKIKYELYPMVVKQHDKNNIDIDYDIRKANSSKRGTRYKEDTEKSIWNKFKKIYNTKRIENKESCK